MCCELTGFGLACMADQVEPVRRKVALEVVKADNPQGPSVNATESITVDGNRFNAAFQTANAVRFYRLLMP